jgi:large subunit ribosomal protein L9
MAVHLAYVHCSVLLTRYTAAAAAAAQVILLKDIESLGSTGQLMNVPIGYWRNFLQPQGIAKVASERILE